MFWRELKVLPESWHKLKNFQAEGYLDKIGEVLAEAHQEFGENMRRTLGEANREFYDQLSQATKLLRAGIQELEVSLSASAVGGNGLMFEGQVVINRRSKDEAEKPFWISFADLMTALMILFLVVMSVALLAVTRAEKKEREAKEKAESIINDQTRAEEERAREIGQLLETLAKNVESEKCPDAKVDRRTAGDRFRHAGSFSITGEYKLDATQQKRLRGCVPEILAIASNELGKKWIKRVIVEGYTDTKGTYLYNLNLSLQRSQRVLCVLLAPDGLSPRTAQASSQSFLVGGFSSNSAKPSNELSRRVELRIKFWGAREIRETTPVETIGVEDLARIVNSIDRSKVTDLSSASGRRPRPRRRDPVRIGLPQLVRNPIAVPSRGFDLYDQPAEEPSRTRRVVATAAKRAQQTADGTT